jgi:hypothetical protein
MLKRRKKEEEGKKNEKGNIERSESLRMEYSRMRLIRSGKREEAR